MVGRSSSEVTGQLEEVVTLVTVRRNAKKYRVILWRVLSACAMFALLTYASEEETGWFVGKIVDKDTGQPLAASIVVTDAKGEVVEIEGEHDHVRYLQRRWCYVDGRFAVPGDGQDVTIEIRRGLETLPVKRMIGAHMREQTFRLQRWINMADRGHMSGDTHVHFLDLDQCHWQMRAEDLLVLNLLTCDFTNDVGKFTGRLATVSTPDHLVYVGQEFRDWQQGHLNLLRLREIVQPLSPFGGIFRDMSERHLLLAPVARAAREQGAAVTWAHFGDMPGAEAPIDIALGLIDAVDLMTQKDPMEIPSHWEPWKMDRPTHLPELPALPGIDLYYQFLNAGFRLPVAAGTDKMSDRIPVGSSRVYVRVGPDRMFDAWIEGLKAGKGFITNGPMLTFDADGCDSGDVVEFHGTRTVTARASARSLHPFTRLQIMVNGEAVATSLEPSRDASGLYETEIEARIALEHSSWIAARVAEPNRDGKAFLPRRMTVFAHTNPVYFLRDGASVRVKDSVDYLLLYLRYTEHWFRTGARFENEQKQREAVRMAQRSLEFYQGL